MSDYLDEGFENIRSGWVSWNPSVRAALIFAIPFGLVDFFNYYSAGVAVTISCPIMSLMYAGCGAVAFRLSAGGDMGGANPMTTGALAGVCLWLISTVINSVISLILGTATIGMTLLLGVPYILCCAPGFLFLGGFLSALGSMGYSSFFHKQSSSEDY